MSGLCACYYTQRPFVSFTSAWLLTIQQQIHWVSERVATYEILLRADGINLILYTILANIHLFFKYLYHDYMLSFITILNPVKTCTSFQNINLCKRASLYYKPRSRKTYSSFSQNISTKKTYSTLDLTHRYARYLKM